MTNNNLRDDLIHEIEGMEAFFRSPPRAMCGKYGLDPDSPLTVRFGPDVETVFVQSGINVHNLDHFPEGTFTGQTSVRFENQGLLNKGLHDSVKKDDEYVEIKLKPESPINLCENYERAQRLLQQVADDFGVRHYGISAHWHRSAEQDGGDAFRTEPKNRDSFFSPLLKNTVAQIISLQERFPAFYVRPFRAEQKHETKNYTGPRWISYDKDDARASIRVKHIGEAFLTVESRVSADDPYQAAYLELKATELALSGDLNITQTGQYILGLDEQEWGGNKRMDDEIESQKFPLIPIRRGAGGYLKMLEETADNLKRFPDTFPSHIAEGMMRDSIAGYEKYFDENHKAKPGEIENLESRMDALKAQFFDKQPAPLPEPVA